MKGDKDVECRDSEFKEFKKGAALDKDERDDKDNNEARASKK